jgi:hypothetical protein
MKGLRVEWVRLSAKPRAASPSRRYLTPTQTRSRGLPFTGCCVRTFVDEDDMVKIALRRKEVHSARSSRSVPGSVLVRVKA